MTGTAQAAAKGFYYAATLTFHIGEIERLRETLVGLDGQPLLPVGVRIDDVRVNVPYAHLTYGYFKRRPDGTEHRRRTFETIQLSRGRSGAHWLGLLLPRDTDARLLTGLQMLWPTPIKSARKVSAT